MTPEQRVEAVKKARFYLTQMKMHFPEAPGANPKAHIEQNLNRFVNIIPKLGGFDESKFKEFAEAAAMDITKFKVLKYICALWVGTGKPVPEAVSSWLQQYLAEEIKTPPGAAKKAVSPQKFALYYASRMIQEEFDIKLDANHASEHGDYAFSIVCDAAKSLNFKHITVNSIRNNYKRLKDDLDCSSFALSKRTTTS